MTYHIFESLLDYLWGASQSSTWECQTATTMELATESMGQQKEQLMAEVMSAKKLRFSKARR